VPPGLTLCQKELGSIAGQFVRLVNYNKQVRYGIHFRSLADPGCFFIPDPGLEFFHPGSRVKKIQDQSLSIFSPRNCF
jgi:hypothetical protein